MKRTAGLFCRSGGLLLAVALFAAPTRAGDLATDNPSAEPTWGWPDSQTPGAGDRDAARCRLALLRGWISQGLPRHRVRHIGLGQPLQGTSWRNRPLYAGTFLGPWFGDTLISGRVDQATGLLGGYWLGYDMDHYWGSELRLSLFYADVEYLPDRANGGSTRNVLADVNLLYYPWGDSRWRPYGSLGLGLAGFHFVDRPNDAVDHLAVQLPIGFGVKYLFRNWLALRLDVKDTLVFGGGAVGTTSNWSIVGALEVHWGRNSSAQYYPW